MRDVHGWMQTIIESFKSCTACCLCSFRLLFKSSFRSSLVKQKVQQNLPASCCSHTASSAHTRTRLSDPLRTQNKLQDFRLEPQNRTCLRASRSRKHSASNPAQREDSGRARVEHSISGDLHEPEHRASRSQVPVRGFQNKSFSRKSIECANSGELNLGVLKHPKFELNTPFWGRGGVWV